MKSSLVFYAPSVHTGGGLVLLQAILASQPTGIDLTAFLDARARNVLILGAGMKVNWVTATVVSRLKAEICLSKISRSDANILCFHGLPPLLPTSAKVFLFLQNRLYIEKKLSTTFDLKTYLRLTLERFFLRTFRHRVSKYLVQTPSMQRDLLQWYDASGGGKPVVCVLPFVARVINFVAPARSQCEWDFIYVADGVAHKNHRNLLTAWQLLAHDNVRPSLALTLSSRDVMLKREVLLLNQQSGLHISDLGQMPHAEVLRLYANSRALIFPSTSESFGLPLIEASNFGLPIIASELDYVRDVCVPTDTFDPKSPLSIARAVKRFLGCPEPAVTLRTPNEFWVELLKGEGA